MFSWVLKCERNTLTVASLSLKTPNRCCCAHEGLPRTWDVWPSILLVPKRRPEPVGADW
jgi:hypothetical protein